ncbi:MAG: transglycosylase SLT domain-containing protein [Blastocatellia bacterium]
MEISGPKINNFVNLDSELLETGTSTKAKQTDNVLPIGVEVKKFSTNNEGKNSLDSSLNSDSPVNLGTSASSLVKASEELLSSGNFKLSLDKKRSGEFPKFNNSNDAQFPPGQLKSHGNKHKTDFPSNPVEVKDKLPNNIPGNSNSLPSPSLPPPIVRPKANELPQINQNNSGKNNTNNSLETNFNQSNLQQVLNQQTVEKQILKTENKLDKVFNKDLDNDLARNPRADKSHPSKPNKHTETPSANSPTSIDEAENTLEIEITQSLEVEQGVENNLGKTDEFPIENEPIDVDPSQSSRIGKGRGKDNNADVVFSNIDVLGNADSLDSPVNNNDLLDNALSSAVGKFAAKNNFVPTTTIPNPEVLDTENLDLNNPETINNPNKFVGSKQVATSFPTSLALSNPAILANPTDKADKTDLNNTTSSSLLGKSSLLGQQARTNDANSIASLIAASNTKVLMIPVGQSLEQVASELGMNVFDLLKANPQLLKDPLLFAGQKLKVPNPQDTVNLANNLTNLNANLTNSQQPLTNQVNSLASQLSANQLNQLDQKQLQLDPTKANLGAIVNTQTELAKANLPHQGHLRVAETERGISGVDRASEKATPTVKQNENFAPTYGVFANRDIEEEYVEARQQSKRKLNLPEPFDEWADYIYSAADKYDLEASLIAAIIWCESAGKNIINGHGHGLMQIDARRYDTWLKLNENGLNPATNIDFGVSILRKNIDYFGKTASGIAAYNCGIDLVEEATILGKGVDYLTSDKNYSFRVLTQQDYFRRFFD